MLYLLIMKLIMINPKLSGLKAFSYLSSRAILALITSIVVSMILYPKAIRLLRSLKAGQPIRELGLEEQMLKKGTPTMGGVVIIFATLFSVILWMDVTNRHFFTLLIITVGYGFIGFLDDYLKISKKSRKSSNPFKPYSPFKNKLNMFLLIIFIAMFWSFVIDSFIINLGISHQVDG